MIESAPEGAVFHRIAAHLRDPIRAGGFPPGSRLPSEPELMRRYGATRVTVRKALDVLVGEWLVVVRQGRGTFVRQPGPVVAVRLADGQEAHLWAPTPTERQRLDIDPQIPVLVVVDADGSESYHPADVVSIKRGPCSPPPEPGSGCARSIRCGPCSVDPGADLSR